MLKKKNIAMAMAVATVATSVAPAFAAVKDQNVDEATMISKVKEVIGVKYFGSDDLVYKVEIVKAGAANTIVKDIKTLEAELASARINDKTVTVSITDNGHIVNNGRIEKTVNAKYELYNNVAADAGGLLTEDALYTLVNAFKNDKIVRSVAYYGVDGKELTGAAAKADTVVDATITLVNGKEIKLAVGDKQLDFKTAVDVNGKEIPVASITSLEMGKQVAGFKTLENPAAATITIPGKIVESLVYNAKEDTKIERNLSDFYDAKGYTKEGVNLVNKLIDANIEATHIVTAISNGKEYSLKFDKDTDLSTVKINKEGKYEITVSLKVEEGALKAGAFTDKAKDVKIVITSDSYTDLTKVKTDMEIADKDDKVAEGKGKYNVLAGANRFETAVEISKKSFVNKDVVADAAKHEANAKAVVLVGQDAIVDGLAAAPLAKQKEAPVLLTKKEAVSDKTMDEIKRVVPRNSTVYIVGGENVISKDVEAQLIKEINAKIVRLAGDTRYETSVKIAQNMKKVDASVMEQAFVVGGFGEADAMSVAAVAANKTAANKIAPIIVSREDGLTQDAKDFLYTNKAALTNVDVVGGTTKVSKQVIKDIAANVDAADTVARVAGDNRQETNSKVISKFYTGKLTGVYVAKDGIQGNGVLIDALAVAPLAGRTDTPIVLATDKISEEQVTAVEKNLKAGDKTMTQAGLGIAQTVLDKLVKLLSL